jgi:uncharacterized protein
MRLGYNKLMSDTALSVPPIHLRDRIPFAAIEDVVRQIANRFHPNQIILFGSYAYGNPRPESDVDLMVVMETSMGETRQGVEILKGINYRFGLDVLVYTPQRLAQRLEWGDPFVREIVTHGKVLYESSDR